MSKSINKIIFKGEKLNYAGKQFYTTPKDVKALLEQKGIAIIPNVLNENECHQMNEGMWKTAKYLTSKLENPLIPSDPSTYDSLSFLEDEPPGLIWSWGWGHAQYVWDVRSNAKVGEVFENIYDTDDLLVSFDGINCNLGALTSDQKFTYKGKKNFHCDQRFNKNGFECIQSWITANPINVGDGTLRILQGSHLLHGEFRKVFEDQLTALDEDWHVLTQEQIQWYKDQGCQDICIVCPAGSQVCWDSRTIHCGMAALHTKDLQLDMQKNQRQHRNVVYVCMMPAEGASKECFETRKAIFGSVELRLKSASHWPKYMTLQPEPSLKSQHIKVPEMPFPNLNERGKKLAGL